MSQEPTETAIPSTDEVIVNPIDTTLSDDEKADALGFLSDENEELIRKFTQLIDAKYNAKSSPNRKTKKSIIDKATRPLLLHNKPWFRVEHIRDSLRFRTALDNFSDLPAVIEDLKAQGWEIIKPETSKMLNPVAWGWRAVMYDLRMPNGQIVEYYVTVKELMDTNDKLHHTLYEKWRNCTDAEVTAKNDEYLEDINTSNEAFEEAFEAYLVRKSQTEAAIQATIDKTNAIT